MNYNNTRFFNINNPINAGDVANIIGGEFIIPEGSNNIMFTNACAMEEAGSSSITFLVNRKYSKMLKESRAGAVILSENDVQYASDNMVIFKVKDPYYAYAKLLEYFYQDKNHIRTSNNVKIAEGSYVAEDAVIFDDVVIGKNCFIDSGVMITQSCVIGDNVKIYHGSTIQYSIIGNNSIIHPGVRIGQDGFGYAFYAGGFYKVPQVGLVIIGENVEIGAGATIDRGSAKDTIIGDGTKIDNLVQIGHNVQIGKHSIVVAMTGIAGSTKIGDYVQIGGQVGIAGHINIGDKVKIAAKSGVHDDIPEGIMVGGIPAQPVMDWHRQTAMLKKMIKKKGDNNE